MASLQAHIAAWVLKLKFKPALAKAEGNAARVRKLMTPAPYRVPRDIAITPGEVGGVAGEWVTPAVWGRGGGSGPGGAARNDRREVASVPGLTMLYLHGGGYVAMSAATHRPMTVAFAQSGFRVFAPNYRLAPEHPFPAAVEDAVAVWSSLLRDHECRPEATVLAGDSAGGGLAVAMMVAARDRGTPLPAAAALFSAWTDMTASGESIRSNDRRCAMFLGSYIALGAKHYLAGANPRDPLASPIYADLSHLPPLVIHVGGDEVLRDDSTRLAERARAAGVLVESKVWPVVPHVWQLVYPSMAEARQSMREATEFLKRHARAGSPVAPLPENQAHGTR